MEKPLRLVCLHGFLGQGGDWESLVQYLPDHWLIACPDLPVPATIGFDAYLALLKSWLMQSHPDPCILLGYSMGARLALTLSKIMPQHYQALILESVHPGLISWSERLERRRNDRYWQQKFRDAEIQRDIDIETRSRAKYELLLEWYSQSVFADLTEQQKRTLIANRSQQDFVIWSKWFDSTGLGLQPDLRDWIRKLPMPCLMISGERDKKFTNLQQELKMVNSDIVSEIITDAGHLPHWQNPKQTAQRIAEFIEQEII